MIFTPLSSTYIIWQILILNFSKAELSSVFALASYYEYHNLKVLIPVAQPIPICYNIGTKTYIHKCWCQKSKRGDKG